MSKPPLLNIDYTTSSIGESGSLLELETQVLKACYLRQIQDQSQMRCLKAEIVETTFVVCRFSDIRHGYDFVLSRIQKKRLETTLI